VDLAVATDVDGDLYVPVVRDAAPLGLRELVEAARAAVERARSGSLDASDIAGGSFTISNLGMFGVESFTPIINAPQIAILGVGATADELVVVDGQARVRPVLRLSLTFDHRAVDGAPAARFLADLRRHLEAADTLTGLG
jgi:pyruvate dehydrogenase E2 component (dihydrolipoamide acetyltransferase)